MTKRKSNFIFSKRLRAKLEDSLRKEDEKRDRLILDMLKAGTSIKYAK